MLDQEHWSRRESDDRARDRTVNRLSRVDRPLRVFPPTPSLRPFDGPFDDNGATIADSRRRFPDWKFSLDESVHRVATCLIIEKKFFFLLV